MKRIALLALALMMLAAPGNCQTGDTDARLARKVTYQAIHKPIKAVLADLTDKTGVTFRAGRSNVDWQVRDRKMNIFVKDVTLAALMNSIARVMEFKWSVSKDTPPVYRLVVDRIQIGKMSAEQSQKADELHERVVEGRTRFADAAVKVAAMNDSQIAQLRDQNPYLYWIGKTGFAKLVTAMFKDLPEFRDTFISAERNMCPSCKGLKPETQQLFLDVMKANYPYWKDAKAKIPNGAGGDLMKCSAGVDNIPRPMTDWERHQDEKFGWIGYTDTQRNYYQLGDFYDPESAFAQAKAKAKIMAAEDDVPAGQANAQGKAGSDPESSADEYLLVDPLVDHPDEPDLTKKIKLEGKPAPEGDGFDVFRKKFAADEKAVAEASGYNVVSDSFSYFSYRFAYTGLQPGDILLKDALNQLATNSFRNWERHGDIVEFRARDWFNKRASQIPDEWVDKWRAQFIKNGTFTLDEWAQIATLTLEQVGENILMDRVLSQCTSYEDWNVLSTGAFLRLYLRLDKDQRALVFSTNGLPISDLTQDQWQLYVATLKYGYTPSWNVEKFMKDNGQGTMLTCVLDTMPNGWTVYKFEVKATDGSGHHGWNVRIPRYSAPKKG